MKKYIIGLDQGTTGTTALLFDANQKLIHKSYREHRQYFPKKAWVEHDPDEIFANVLTVIKDLIQSSGIESDQIAGLGITNQRETSVAWNRSTSKPISRAIVWQCHRTSAICDRMKKNKKLNKKIQRLTGLTIDPYFSATKFSWLLKNEKKLKNEQIALGTIDSWLIWKFTHGQQHLTDVTNASRTMLFDIQKQCWSADLCKLFGVPMDALAQVKPSIHNFGHIHKDFFGVEIPILAVLGDQQSSLFAHGAVKPFQAKCTFGTGAFLLVHCGNKPLYSKHQLLTTAACSSDANAQYALEGSVFMAGSIIQWLREIKIIEQASQIDQLATSVSSNEGLFLIPAFAGLGAPYWKPNVRAILTGMHLGTTRAHIARASLEAIAFQVYDLINAIQKDIGKKINDLHVDGGVTNSDFLMQFLADILQISIHKSSMIEMTAFGAAKAAAASLKLWEISDVQHAVVFSPKINRTFVKPLVIGWDKAMQQALLT